MGSKCSRTAQTLKSSFSLIHAASREAVRETHSEELTVDSVDGRLDQRRDQGRHHVQSLAVGLGEPEKIARERNALLEILADQVAVIVLELRKGGSGSAYRLFESGGGNLAGRSKA